MTVMGKLRRKRVDLAALRSQRDLRASAIRLREWAAEASRTGFTEYAFELHMFANIAERAAEADRVDRPPEPVE